jgi:hypothetical protein
MEERQTNMPQFPSAFSLFRSSVDALMLNIWTFLALFLVPMAGLMGILPLAAMSKNQELLSGAAVILLVVVTIFFILVGPALPYLQLKSVQGDVVSLGEALKASKTFFWRFYGQGLLIGLLILGGLVLLIIPGILMLKRYYLAPYYMYDQNLDILESMRKSAADAKKFSGAVWAVLGVTVLIQLPGIIPPFGLISVVLALMYYCAPVVRYFQIKSAAHAHASKKTT